MKPGPFVRLWMPVFFWMMFVFTASTDVMSAEHTSRFLEPILRWFAPEISAATLLALQFFIRKMAHLTEYAVLGALLWRALRGSFSATRNGLLATVAFLVAAVFAASDEFHQSFIPSRTASPRDVMIDICGVIVGLLIYRTICPQSSTIIPSQTTR